MENKIIKVAHVIGLAINGGTESLWMNYYKHIDRTMVQFDFLVESESAIINKKEIEPRRLVGRGFGDAVPQSVQLFRDRRFRPLYRNGSL